MASNPYIKSLIWLVSLGGTGYALLLLTEPSAEKLDKIKSSSSNTHISEDERKKLLFMQRLKEATTDKTPIYMQKKEK